LIYNEKMNIFNNRDEFIKARLEEKQKIFDKILKNFSEIALEAHVFGSSANGLGDEFSDIDFWATFFDEEVEEVINKRFNIFESIGEILIFHEAQQNYPLGGIYTLLLYKTDSGPIHIDFYLSPVASARLWGDTRILFNKRNLEIPKGEMIYDPKREKRDAQDRVKFVICMTFSGIKKITRKDYQFLDFLVEIYNDLRQKSFPEMAMVANQNSFETVKKILHNLANIANEQNKNAIYQIESFLKQVRELYS